MIKSPVTVRVKQNFDCLTVEKEIQMNEKEVKYILVMMNKQVL